MIDRARESRNPKKVIRVTLMESYGGECLLIFDKFMLLNGTGGENDSVRVCCICFLSRKKKRGKLNFPMCKEEQA